MGLDAVDLALMGYDALVSLAVYLIPNMNPVVVLLAAGQRKLLLCGLLNDDIVFCPGFKLIHDCDLSRHCIVAGLDLVHPIGSIAPADHHHKRGGQKKLFNIISLP